MAVTIKNSQVHNLQIGPALSINGLMSCWDAASIFSYPRTGSIWYDLIGNNHGSMINMAPDNFSEDVSGSLVFDGTDEYVSVPHNSSLDAGTGSFTVTAWIKPDVLLASNSYVVTKRGSGESGAYAGWTIQVVNQGGVGWSFTDAGVDDASSNSQFAQGYLTYNFEWTHIAMVYNNDQFPTKFTLYANGFRDLSKTIIGTYGTLSNSVPLEIGGTRYLNGESISTVLSPFKGSIAQVQFYKTALSEASILQNYTALKGRFGL